MSTNIKKATSFYDDWKKRLDESVANAPEFCTTKGWFDRFKNRAKLHSIKLTGESASANKQAALDVVERFVKTVEDKAYSAHQIFNVDERGLFWKMMPD